VRNLPFNTVQGSRMLFLKTSGVSHWSETKEIDIFFQLLEILQKVLAYVGCFPRRPVTQG